MQGAALPYAIYNHAMINMDNENIMIIGGNPGIGYCTAQTRIFDHKIWSVGPSLIQARRSHAAGIVTDEATMETYAIVTGGFYDVDFLKSTEILKGDTWFSGKNSISVKRSRTTKC